MPITLHKDGRSRPPHLRPWRDGWRHLRFMLIYSPRWLFLVPGLLLGGGGGLAALFFYFAWERQAAPTTALNGFALASASAVAGLQLVATAFFTKVFGLGEGLLPEDRRFSRVFRHFTLERGMLGGAALFLRGSSCCCGCWCFPAARRLRAWSMRRACARYRLDDFARARGRGDLLELLHERAGAEDGDTASAGPGRCSNAADCAAFWRAASPYPFSSPPPCWPFSSRWRSTSCRPLLHPTHRG